MFTALVPAAVQALAEALDDPKLKVKAAQTVLDRALGKAITPVDMKVTSTTSPAAMVAALRDLAALAQLAPQAAAVMIDALPLPAPKRDLPALFPPIEIEDEDD